jgi:[ribosomal protein S18]-alanine N-acetyltransferase
MRESDTGAAGPLISASFDPQFGEAWSLDDVRGVMALHGCQAYLARTPQESAAGIALIRQVLDEAELLLIAVSPALRCRGIGTALLKHAIAQAVTSGAKSLFLEVRENNVQAIALYMKHGFTLMGRRTKYYQGKHGSLFDALTLKLNLTQHNPGGNNSVVF